MSFDDKAKALSRYFKGKGSLQRAREWLENALKEGCKFCGVKLSLSSVQLDHYLPQSCGEEANEESNFVPSCETCNRAKGNLDGWEFIRLIDMLDGWEQEMSERKGSGNATVKHILISMKNVYRFKGGKR